MPSYEWRALAATASRRPIVRFFLPIQRGRAADQFIHSDGRSGGWRWWDRHRTPPPAKRRQGLTQTDSVGEVAAVTGSERNGHRSRIVLARTINGIQSRPHL